MFNLAHSTNELPFILEYQRKDSKLSIIIGYLFKIKNLQIPYLSF